MSTATLYCSQARRFLYSGSSWSAFQQSTVGYIPQASGSNIGGMVFRFDAIPDGVTITSATLHIMTALYSGGGTANVNFRVSNAADLYGNVAPSDPSVLGLAFSTTPTMRSIVLSYQVGTYASPESYTYLYIYKPGGGIALTDVIFGATYNDAYFGSVNAPYITIEYTVPVPNNDTVGRYNGSTFENCEAYRYNGSTWELQDVFRYDGTQFVECSTT